MRELIDRKSLIEALRKDIQEYKDTDGQSIPFKTGMLYRQIDVIKIIEEQPTVEAVPLVHGEWIHVPSSDMATGRAYECSNCKKMRYGSFLPPFCQMCGADMRKKV